jgi:hypothetical protein
MMDDVWYTLLRTLVLVYSNQAKVRPGLLLSIGGGDLDLWFWFWHHCLLIVTHSARFVQLVALDHAFYLHHVFDAPTCSSLVGALPGSRYHWQPFSLPCSSRSSLADHSVYRTL